MTLRLRPEARDDLRIAIAWYEEREPGLGPAFLAEAEALFQQITKRTRRYPVIHAFSAGRRLWRSGSRRPQLREGHSGGICLC